MRGPLLGPCSGGTYRGVAQDETSSARASTGLGRCLLPEVLIVRPPLEWVINAGMLSKMPDC